VHLLGPVSGAWSRPAPLIPPAVIASLTVAVTVGTSGLGLALVRDRAPGSGGLTKPSFALIAHVRSIDARRIRRMFGQVSSAELTTIDQGRVVLRPEW
jgi:mRNA-degrading endonuclease toxin of MazEF toxin-antitoxin module